MRERAGKRRVHETAIAIVAAPPATTAVTVPTRAATTPRAPATNRSRGSSGRQARKVVAMGNVDRSTIWPYDELGEPREFYYQRNGDPTGAEAEALLGDLDKGTALLFPSGAGATAALALAILKPGDTIALAAGCYYGTGKTFEALAPWGLNYVEYDQTGPPPDGVQLIWTEAPSNPYLTMPDLVAAVAHPAPLVVDATVATPILLRPLEHGADFVVHSATKYLAGHDDAMLGAVVCRDPKAADTLRTLRTLSLIHI